MESSGHTSGDHFYPDTDIAWTLIDTRTKRTLRTFHGRWDDPSGISRLVFSRNGRELLAKDDRGRILERVDLEELSRDLRKKGARVRKRKRSGKKAGCRKKKE